MRFDLRRDSRTTPDAASGPGRRPGRIATLVTGGLALFALAASPMGQAASDGVPDSVSTAVSTSVASLASTTLQATTSEGPHGYTQPEARAVRTAVAMPIAPTERWASYEPVREPEVETVDEAETADEPAGEEAAQEAGQQQAQDDTSAQATSERSVWDRLADCESGDWDANSQPLPGTARWDYGLEFAHEGFEQFQGGLNFHPGTWDAYRDPHMPDHAGHATREQQIVVGERVLASQGWGAWPVCSEMIGLR